jgi:hypothetical protein
MVSPTTSILHRGLAALEGVGFVQIAPHQGRDDREHGTERKWHAPAPGPDLLSREKHLLQEKQHEDGAELPADQGHVLEAGVEAAILLVGDLTEIGGAGAVFAAEAQPLQDPREAEDDGSGQTDRSISRCHRNDQRPEAHHHDGQRQRVAPAIAIGQMAEHPAAERAHQEARSKQQRRIELLHHLVAIREERLGEIQGERRIGVEIVPLDEIADRADEDRAQPALHVGDIGTLLRDGRSDSLNCGFL